MGYFDDLNNPDWGENTAAAKVMSSTPAPYRVQANYNAQVRAGQRNPQSDATPAWQKKQTADVHSYMDQLRIKHYGSLENYKKATQSTPTKNGQPAQVTRRATRRPVVNWDKQYQDFLGRMTDDQKAWLAQRGIDYSSAQKMQEYLTRVGKSVGRFGADNKWGKDSQAAWDDLVNTTMKNNPLQKPVATPEPVVDASDPFGYESKGNYALDNARTLKTNGIRDWTTMLNYIKGNQESAFAQDMMHRFGSDLSKWKQEDVEGAIGVSGHYGSKDRSRIQGFMAGNQATWNNQRQAAINDYAKKTFLANRSGANTLGGLPGLSKEWAGTDGTA